MNNAQVKDGALTITLKKEKSDSGEDIYTSARLVSRDQGDWLYGRFEVRAKLPTGKGTWPAIWMMPTDSAYGTWPASGEIDILEYVGYQPGIVHASVHTLNYYFKKGNNFTKKTPIENKDDYHIYALEWTPGKLEFFVDGLSYGVYEDGVTLANGEKADFSKGWESFPFDKKFYMILNIAYGGDWGGAGGGVDDSILPKTMVVDYVRVYGYDFHKSDSEALLGTSKTNKFEVKDLEPETTYSFQLRAVDIAGNKSGLSPLVAKKTKAYTPYLVTKKQAPKAIPATEYENMQGIDVEKTADTTNEFTMGKSTDPGAHFVFALGKMPSETKNVD